MAMTDARRAQLLAYCRINEPTDEELLTLEGLYEAAVGYLETAGVSQPPEGTPRRAQYDLCVDFMVLRDFDLRDATITGTIVSDHPAFRRLINQLKLSEPVDVSQMAIWQKNRQIRLIPIQQLSEPDVSDLDTNREG